MRERRSIERKRKQYRAAFKAKIGLEALIGFKTTAQIARENQVHPRFVGQWKAVLRGGMPEHLEHRRIARKLIARLHQKIGQLTVNLDWLKQCNQLGLSPPEANSLS
jgi:transposase